MARLGANAMFLLAAGVALGLFVPLVVLPEGVQRWATTPGEQTTPPETPTPATETASSETDSADPAASAEGAPSAAEEAVAGRPKDADEETSAAGDAAPGKVVLELDSGRIEAWVASGEADADVEAAGSIPDTAGSLALRVRSHTQGRATPVEMRVVTRDVPGHAPDTVVAEQQVLLLAGGRRAFRYTPETGVLAAGAYRLEAAVVDGPSGSAPFTVTADTPWAELAEAGPRPGGFNLALATLGGRVTASSQYDDDNWAADNLIDGFVLIREADGRQVSSGWRSSFGGVPAELVFELAGSKSARIHAVEVETVRVVFDAADAVASGERESIVPERVNVHVAERDADDAYRPVASARLRPRSARQRVRFEPVRARYVKLVIPDNHGADTVGLGEVAVLEVPDGPSVVSGGAVNLARPALGGRVVRFTSQMSDNPVAALFDGAVGDDASWVSGAGPRGDAGFLPQRFVLAFDRYQRALIDRIVVQPESGREHYGREPEAWPAEIAVAIKDDALADFEPVASRGLPRETDAVEIPVNRKARYLQVAITANHGAPRTSLGEIRVLEGRADGYRSILRRGGEDGDASNASDRAGLTVGWLADLDAITESEPNDSLKQANSLTEGSYTRGVIRPATDEDFYAFSWAGERGGIATVDLTAAPRMWIRLSLLDDDGAHRHRFWPTDAAVTSARLSWRLQPGDYHLSVSRTPASTVLVWDDSGSMSQRRDELRRAVTSYLEHLQPGEEVRLMAFSDEVRTLGEGFTDDGRALAEMLEGHFRAEGETALYDAVVAAAEALEGRPGRRAILLLSDGGDTASKAGVPEVWHAVEAAQAGVYGIGVGWEMRNYSLGAGTTGADGLAALSRTTGGRYMFAPDAGGIEDIYSDLAADLSRELHYAVRPVLNAGQGSLAVIATGERLQGVSAPSYFELVLDASGSMKEAFDGRTRMAVARDAVSQVLESLPDDVQVGLRVFGSRVAEGAPGDCEDTQQLVPLTPLAESDIQARVQTVEALGTTLIAESMRQAAADLDGVPGEKMVILVTDGEEECSDDPGREIRALLAEQASLRLNIVGFALADAAVKGRLAELANLTGGAFFDAARAGELQASLDKALSAPFVVRDAGGNAVAEGRVDGGAVDVPAGRYTVDVPRRGEPVRVSGVDVVTGERTRVALEKEGDLVDVTVDAPPAGG